MGNFFFGHAICASALLTCSVEADGSSARLKLSPWSDEKYMTRGDLWRGGRGTHLSVDALCTMKWRLHSESSAISPNLPLQKRRETLQCSQSCRCPRGWW